MSSWGPESIRAFGSWAIFTTETTTKNERDNMKKSTPKNTNCLEGFKCPSCGWTQDFIIWVNTAFRVTDDGTEHQGATKWNEHNHCACGKCPYEATVAEFTRGKLPPDPDGENDTRAAWADAALQTFMNDCCTDREDAVCDLVCDLHHWCDRNGLDFYFELRRSEKHYAEETRELDPDENAIDLDRQEGGDQ
jgi:hypothetical protein